MFVFDMRYGLSLLLIFACANSIFAQVVGTVLDSSTKNPVPYVNISVKDTTKGTTADERGRFLLTGIDSNQVITFSAVGYSTIETPLNKISDTIYLPVQSITFPDVIVTDKRSLDSKQQSIATFRKSDIYNYSLAALWPVLQARFFSDCEEFHETPYLQAIKVATQSPTKNLTFNIRLYLPDEYGQPGNYLYNYPILAQAKKGKNTTEVDLKELNIRIPHSGFFVAVETLAVPSDIGRKLATVSDAKGKEAPGVEVYGPKFGYIKSENNQNFWDYSGGKWHNNIEHHFESINPNLSESVNRYLKGYSVIAIELVLSN